VRPWTLAAFFVPVWRAILFARSASRVRDASEFPEAAVWYPDADERSAAEFTLASTLWM
jgi:hypothetical protein